MDRSAAGAAVTEPGTRGRRPSPATGPATGQRAAWPWAAFAVADPRPWLLECDEPEARWVTLTAVLDVLVRAGRADHPKVRAGLHRLGADLTRTAQGRAWPCLPHPVTGFRGPGREGDFCPHVTVEGLRVLAADAAAVDVTALGSSKGGAGTALPPAPP